MENMTFHVWNKSNQYEKNPEFVIKEAMNCRSKMFDCKNKK